VSLVIERGGDHIAEFTQIGLFRLVLREIVLREPAGAGSGSTAFWTGTATGATTGLSSGSSMLCLR